MVVGFKRDHLSFELKHLFDEVLEKRHFFNQILEYLNYLSVLDLAHLVQAQNPKKSDERKMSNSLVNLED